MLDILAPAAARFDAALRQAVNADGRVNYAALANAVALHQQIEALRAYDLRALKTRAERIAFWINAYNTLALASIIAEWRRKLDYHGVFGGASWGWWPPSGVKDLLGAARFFMRRFDIGERKLSLFAIERQILWGELREARAHFALVCGAASCPPLRRGLYSVTHLDTELDLAAHNFIAYPRNVLIERDSHTLWLSSTFKWYRRDFEQIAGDVLHYIAQYRNADDRAYLDRHGAQVRLRYFKFDWSLNQQV